MSRGKARLGVLLSGRGSNFLAIAGAVLAGDLSEMAEIGLVVTDVEGSEGARRAAGLEFPVLTSVSKGRKRAEQEAEVIAGLLEHEIDYICLAGYMRLLSADFVKTFPQRILNIHPSLLPAFPGLDAQGQALRFGVKLAGCTVHFVDEQVDHGVIILQRAIDVLDEDDEASLSARVLVEEHLAYPEAIARVVSGEYKVDGRRYLRTS